MARADIKVSLNKDATAFLSTRLVYCGAYDCRNNLINRANDDRMACRLREVDVGPGGECYEYDPLEEEEARH